MLERTWFDRNWKWFVPVLVVSVCLLLALFVLAILAFVESLIGTLYPYKMAVQEAEQSEQVAESLGRPLHIGRFSTGQINLGTGTGDANISIPISGPTGTGHIIVSGKEKGYHWTFDTLEVEVEGDDTPIPLPDPGANEIRSPPPGSIQSILEKPSGTLRSGGDTLADKIDDSLRGGSRKKDFGDAGLLQSWNVGFGDNSADQHGHVIHAFCAQEFHEPRAECVVRAGKNRKADDVNVFLYRR